MNKKLGLISKILDGTKTIESRWYKNKSAPWNKINSGDTVYYKNSGGLATAKAEVSKVLQFEGLTQDKIKEIVDKYGGVGKINLVDSKGYKNWSKGKNYCILIFLKNPQEVKPFKIDKTGFGIGTAWITVNSISQIRRGLTE